MLWAISVRVDEIRAFQWTHLLNTWLNKNYRMYIKNMGYHVYITPHEIITFVWWQKWEWDDCDK